MGHEPRQRANTQNAYLLKQQIAPKNGWVFVYISNESDENVYFDNLIVTQEHSRIAEETHYYPGGLKIAGISSKAFNKLENKYGYQGDFSEKETETGWDEFLLRNYDPQIGRWTGVDPYIQFASPYIGMGNDPVNYVDPSGGSIFNLFESSFLNHAFDAAVGAIAGGVIYGASNGWNKDDVLQGMGYGAVGGLGASFVNWGSYSLRQIFESPLRLAKEKGELQVKYWPLYNNPDAAAAGFSKWASQNQGGSKPREYSSLIYLIKTKDRRKYYSYTMPMKYVSDFGEHHAPPPEQLNQLNLLPAGAIENGYIHSHTFPNAPEGNLPSRADGNIIGRYHGGPIYFLNSSGLLQRWGRVRRNFIPIVRGYKNGPVKPVEGDFDFGESLDMSEVNYYDIFK